MKKKFVRTLTFETRQSRDDQLPLEVRVPADYACKPGLKGNFVALNNDFSLLTLTESPGKSNKNEPNYEDKSDDRYKTKRQRLGRVRYFVCSLALAGNALSLMSRLILNVAIVEMVKRRPSNQLESMADVDGGHFEWSQRDINMILGSFYVGYAPGVLLSGSLAQRHGAKWPMFVCVFLTALINLLTPAIAETSLNFLIGSRITLGLIQGTLVPCIYELYNRWLTRTESSMFVPLIRLPLGLILGTMMPGLLAAYNLEWPYLFQVSGYLCLGWSLAWVLLVTSRPQDNNLISMDELTRIMRKKHVAPPITSGKHQDGRKPTPWLLIITNRSVLSLIALKFTGNMASDFIFLQIAVYLREIHQAPIETISAIASGNYCLQILFIGPIGWLAKTVVLRRTLGLSVTKLRKLFSGGSNFAMGLAYLVLAYAQPNLMATSCLFLLVCFFAMFAVGGESMLPYDLSSEYPASIVAVTHSVSVFSAIVMAAMCNLVLGENTREPARWSLLFYLLASALTLGGLIFVLVVKAKPFLPGEKVAKRNEPIPSVSHTIEMTNNFKSNGEVIK